MPLARIWSQMRRKVLLVTWVLMAGAWVWIGYMNFIELPRLRAETDQMKAEAANADLDPPSVRCTEGMTLLPHQSCYMGIEIHLAPKRDNEL